MSRTFLRTAPALALTCLGTALFAGCLDPDETGETGVTTDPKDPLVLLAVASSPELALPPKPALAQLATADSATQKRFVDAALGADVSDVFTSVVGLALSPASTCPAVGRRGDRIYSAADCTDDDGVHWSGNLRAQTWSDSRPMTIELERWSMDPPGTKDDRAWDGTVTIDPNGRFTANLVVYKDGRVSRTVATWEANDGRVIADVDSYVLVQDHGIAQIGGAWRLPRDERATGTLFLQGAQELTLDFDGIDPAGDGQCAPMYVDGVTFAKRCELGELATHLTAFELF